MLDSLGVRKRAQLLCSQYDHGRLCVVLLLSLLLHLVAFAGWGSGERWAASSVRHGYSAPLSVSLATGALRPTIGHAPVFQRPRVPPRNSVDDLQAASEGGSGWLVPPELLSGPPSILEDVEVDYPDEDQSLDGVVRLKLAISASGGVMSIAVVDTNLPVEYVEQAIAAFANRRFAPGRMGQRAVPTAIEMEVIFSSNGIF